MSIAGIVTQLGTPQNIVTRGLVAGAAVEVIESFSGGFFDFEALRPRLKPKKKEDKKAVEIIEKVAKKIAKTPIIETTKEIDLAIRLLLEKENIVYKKIYLQWTKQQIKAEELRIKRKKKRQDEETIILMMLH